MSQIFERIEASVQDPSCVKQYIDVDLTVHNRCPHPLCQGRKGGTLLFKGRLMPGTAIEVVCPKCSKRENRTTLHRFGAL